MHLLLCSGQAVSAVNTRSPWQRTDNTGGKQEGIPFQPSDGQRCHVDSRQSSLPGETGGGFPHLVQPCQLVCGTAPSPPPALPPHVVALIPGLPRPWLRKPTKRVTHGPEVMRQRCALRSKTGTFSPLQVSKMAQIKRKKIRGISLKISLRTNKLDGGNKGSDTHHLEVFAHLGEKVVVVCRIHATVLNTFRILLKLDGRTRTVSPKS